MLLPSRIGSHGPSSIARFFVGFAAQLRHRPLFPRLVTARSACPTSPSQTRGQHGASGEWFPNAPQLRPAPWRLDQHPCPHLVRRVRVDRAPRCPRLSPVHAGALPRGLSRTLPASMVNRPISTMAVTTGHFRISISGHDSSFSSRLGLRSRHLSKSSSPVTNTRASRRRPSVAISARSSSARQSAVSPMTCCPVSIFRLESRTHSSSRPSTFGPTAPASTAQSDIS